MAIRIPCTALLLAALLLAALATPAGAQRGALTHTSPLTPTGELVGAGRFERTQSLAAFHHDLAIGLTDRIELRLQSPGLPVPIMGGALVVRASLLPPGRLRLVAAGGVAAEWFDGADLYLDASLTAAWRGPGFTAHLTGRTLDHRAPGGGDHHPRVGLASGGVTVAAGGRTTLFADAGELAWLRAATCPGKHGEPRSCRVRDAARGVMAGAWWSLRDMDVGLAMLVAWRGGTVLPVGPLLSFRWERHL